MEQADQIPFDNESINSDHTESSCRVNSFDCSISSSILSLVSNRINQRQTSIARRDIRKVLLINPTFFQLDLFI